jgi:hypothetical protein
MDADLKKILAELPIKPPRSRLEPYREFIEELRSRGRTYRDIAEILAEKCAIQVTGSGIHDFVRTRIRAKDRSAGGGSTSKSNPPSLRSPVAAETSPSSPSREEVQRKIAALKVRNTAEKPGPRGFEYDPDEPLRLKPSRRE